MNISITISDPYMIETITKIATENKLTVDQYATNILTGWIEDQIRGLYIHNARTTSLENLKSKIGKIDVITKSISSVTSTIPKEGI